MPGTFSIIYSVYNNREQKDVNVDLLYPKGIVLDQIHAIIVKGSMHFQEN